MDFGWLLIAASLVFLMQAGFLCLETGKIRSKNSINVAAKNLADFILAVIIFWLFGFGLMFGDSSWGILGTSAFLFGADQTPWEYSFFFFQLMFCGTAATLMSGAVAERITFFGYVIITIILCSLIYPIVGHWAWASIYNSANSGWLEAKGFVDFAGSTVVHSVGGWVALAAVMILGPRLGRFSKNRQMPSGSNLPMSVLGTLLIWLGWFGFNGGSTLAMNDDVPPVLLHTCLAAAFGGLTSATVFVARHRYVDVTFILNGVIAGLVAITAGANVVTPGGSALIGIIGGLVYYVGTGLLVRWKIDDVLGVVPAHLFAGAWGTVAVALFGVADKLPLPFVEQLKIQFLGVSVIGAYCFAVSYGFIYAINKLIPLRVSARNEMLGMNISEHHASTELIDLMGSMKSQERRGNFTNSVPVEPFTEVGQIARQYNRVIQRVQDEMNSREQAIDNFRSSEQRKSAILDSSMDSIITIDLNGEIIEFNPAAERTFGAIKGQVIGKNFISLFVLPDDQPIVRNSLSHKFAASSGLLINRRNAMALRRRTGDEFPAEIAITDAKLGREIKNEFTLHVRDVTRQHKVQAKLKQLAYSDPLTGLYNRTYLMESLQLALSREAGSEYRTAVFFLDLDRFKKINDTLGHKAGDELLLEVAARLMRVTRESDTIARWGGDEFVILMTGTLGEDVIENTASKILEVMREPMILNGRELKIPTSIGVAISDAEDESPELIIQHADIAMYYAKEDGRDNYKLFKPEMANKASEQFDLEQALRKAISEKDQFVVVYQPKVDENQLVVGLEALVRWQHPDGQLIPPGNFIPQAEEANLIIPIEEQIIELVCRQLATWRTANLPLLPVAINLSGKHLLSPALLPFVELQLERFGLEGELIEFEVTEGVFLTDIDRCKQVLTDLRKRKIRISIDDFGTGYSSLNYLKTLPVDVLKIDRSFVEECTTSQEDEKICATIIRLAENLHLRTIAEGVETQAQFDFLKQHGCNEFQGYYFYRPLQEHEITNIIELQSKAVMFS